MAFTLTTLFVLINLLYYRNFSIPLPLSSIFMLKNMDAMVFQATWDSLDLFISMSLLPLIALTSAWWLYFRKRIKGKSLSHRRAKTGIVFGMSLWFVAQLCSTTLYIKDNIDNATMPGYSSPQLLTEIAEKYRGKVMTHTEYLYYNGLEFYLIWGMGDFSPAITLSHADIDKVTAFTTRQKELNASNPITFEKDSVAARKSIPNLLIIMIESFETWPLECKIDAHPCLQYMDSLIRLPGTLYFPHVVSQAASGRSSDGHLLCLTGLLPLRDSPAVMDFSGNDYPTIIKAYKEKYGGTATEIISDEPEMWNQGETYKRYGFDKLYSVKDMDPDKSSSWLTRDYYWGKFTTSRLKEQSTPFACMTVSLSLHTPYRSKIKGNEEIDTLNLPDQSKHYLKVCKRDEQYIKWMIDALHQRDIYHNTVIVITGDHVAHGLTEDGRAAFTRGKEKYLPLIVLNSGYKTGTYPYTAGQVDIYPTLLDIMELHDYRWRGLGLSMLRFRHSGATRSNMETVGTHTHEERERERQRTAWSISNLLIRSNHLGQTVQR